MDVGSLDAWESFIAQHTPQEVAIFYGGIQAGIIGENAPLCALCKDQDEPLDALHRKGKGKGKGKRGFTPSASASGGKGNQGGGAQGGGLSGHRPFSSLAQREGHACLSLVPEDRARDEGLPSEAVGQAQGGEKRQLARALACSSGG